MRRSANRAVVLGTGGASRAREPPHIGRVWGRAVPPGHTNPPIWAVPQGTSNPHDPMAGTPHDRSAIMTLEAHTGLALHGTPNPAHHPMAGTPHARSAIMGPSCWTARTACISVVVSQLYLTGMLPGGDSAVKERQQPCARATPVLSNSSVLIITECEALWRRVVTHRRLH